MPTAVASRPSTAVKSQSPERQRLAAMIEKLGFGLIEDLLVIAGQPQFDPRPKRTRVVNFDADDASGAKRSGREYRLRTMAALFRCLDTVRERTFVSIVVKHGLPARLSIREPVEA